MLQVLRFSRNIQALVILIFHACCAFGFILKKVSKKQRPAQNTKFAPDFVF
jgi:hypothetical protein